MVLHMLERECPQCVDMEAMRQLCCAGEQADVHLTDQGTSLWELLTRADPLVRSAGCAAYVEERDAAERERSMQSAYRALARTAELMPHAARFHTFSPTRAWRLLLGRRLWRIEWWISGQMHGLHESHNDIHSLIIGFGALDNAPQGCCAAVGWFWRIVNVLSPVAAARLPLPRAVAKSVSLLSYQCRGFRLSG